MTKWEYKVVGVRVLDIGFIVKRGSKEQKAALLDPEIDDWLKLTWKEGNLDLGRVARSDRGCWTTLEKCLQELGRNEWELVGTEHSPRELRFYFGSTGSIYYDGSYLYFKRPGPDAGGVE